MIKVRWDWATLHLIYKKKKDRKNPVAVKKSGHHVDICKW